MTGGGVRGIQRSTRLASTLVTTDPTTTVRITYATVIGPRSSSTEAAVASLAIAIENSPRRNQRGADHPRARTSEPSRRAAHHPVAYFVAEVTSPKITAIPRTGGIVEGWTEWVLCESPSSGCDQRYTVPGRHHSHTCAAVITVTPRESRERQTPDA